MTWFKVSPPPTLQQRSVAVDAHVRGDDRKRVVAVSAVVVVLGGEGVGAVRIEIDDGGVVVCVGRIDGEDQVVLTAGDVDHGWWIAAGKQDGDELGREYHSAGFHFSTHGESSPFVIRLFV
ncbi:MAG: hypothetical protein P8Z34_15650 [Anaerolineales bacterium]